MIAHDSSEYMIEYDSLGVAFCVDVGVEMGAISVVHLCGLESKSVSELNHELKLIWVLCSFKKNIITYGGITATHSKAKSR